MVQENRRLRGVVKGGAVGCHLSANESAGEIEGVARCHFVFNVA